MLLENNQLYHDDQNTSENNGILSFDNILKAGVIGILGTVAYKKGLLKDIINPLMQTMDLLGREGLDRAGLAMSTIKQWSNLKHLTPGQIKASKTTVWSAAENSIFRTDRKTSLGYDLIEDFKNSVNKGQLDFYNVKRLIQGSSEDVQTLNAMLRHRLSHIDDIRKDYTNTDLYRGLRDFENFVKTGEIEFGKLKENKFMFQLQRKFTEEFVKSMTVSDEELSEQLFTHGFRNVILSDIAEMGKDHKLALKPGTLDINDRRNKTYESLLEKINKNFSNSWNSYDGKPLFGSDSWQNIIVDSNLFINESGKFYDTRMSRDTFYGALRSLANDFKLPLVGFNPFKMLQFDKIGRKNIFAGFLSPDQIDPSITGRTGEYTIRDFLTENFNEKVADRPIAVINGKAYVSENFGVGSKLIELEGNYKLHDITNADSSYGLVNSVNLERQMANLDIGSPLHSQLMQNENFNFNTRAAISEQIDQYNQWLVSNGQEQMNPFQTARFALGRFLDIGNQEVRLNNEESGILSLDNATNIDEFINDLIGKATSIKPLQTTGMEYKDVAEMTQNLSIKNFKTIFGEGFEENLSEFYKPRMYYAQRAGVTFSEDVWNAFKEDRSKGLQKGKEFLAQFFVGRDLLDNTKMSKYFTERSTTLFSIPNQLSEGIGASSHLFGLSTESKGNVLSLSGNLILKRALPVYALTQVPGIINGLSEPFMGRDKETGQPNNISRWMMSGPVKNIDLTMHSVLDITGFTNIFKNLKEFVPGYDQIEGIIPFIPGIGLDQTREEREDYIENGYDPIRKGRFWSSGNTPWTGGKIEYWRPNIYRRVQADVEFSDSKWGSRQEYYNNTWFPNPLNPFAPINHFILDKNHYDKKHYYDRPYLQTSPEGSNIPIIGPMFSQTVGRVINPPRKMHMEYWRNGLQPLEGDEEPSTLITEGKLYSKLPNINYTRFYGSQNDAQIFQQINLRNAEASKKYQDILYTSAYIAKQMTKTPFTDSHGITFQNYSILPTRTYDRYDNPYEIYSTPSGGLSIVDVPDDLNLYNVNQDLKQWSINKIIGTNQRVTIIDNFQGPGELTGKLTYDNEFLSSGLGEQYNTLTDVAGLRGFMLTEVVGQGNKKARQIEGSNYAYSMNKTFWDQNIGGLGGNLSEISRRFVQQRTKMDYINPIRNTMPNWMPGSNYFTDFKHGDPYSKIMNGEERLPGEGYERLHGITGLTDLKIGSSYLGYSKADITKHLIGQDNYQSAFEQDTLDKGTKIHNKIERQWLESGLAIETEGKIQDKRNGIIGYYDALIHDPTSATGLGIVDIKTTSAKKLDEIRKSGKPLDHHRKQVNYYLWATQNENSNGYVYYVDKENLDNSYLVGFNYSKDLLKESMENLYGARNDIKKALKSGIIGRGDLYSNLDKYRILADVAPYSQEFKDMQAVISGSKLSEEEQREVSQIRERVKQQKEPLRVYDYKFKTANLKTETVTVDRIIDNNTIVTKEYGKKHSVKFAGIRVSESNSDMYNDELTMSQAASKEIKKYIKKGSKITISYDADDANKFKTDSTRSIRAVVQTRSGRNVNKILVNKGVAKENEDDNSPAGIHARYSQGQIAFGSAMETLTHSFSTVPFVNKLLQVRSPYESYRYREVYSKDFQSWSHPIRDMLIPNADLQIANTSFGHIGGIVSGAYIGSLFGRNRAFGGLIGAVVGGTTTAIGKVAFALGTDKDRDWRPKRRIQQEQLNEYVDILKYVKATSLYEKYKTKAKKENNFDVDKFINSKESSGALNKQRQRELTDFKRKVKLDFKHRDRYNFKYGRPKYVDYDMSKQETIKGINQEINELQSQRKVTKAPLNALKALEYKKQAENTMYAFNAGDNLTNIMRALPKKDRQYFKHFMNAPEEEKEKILRIAPSYLRRALQATWNMPVDKKPNLNKYFMTHALPDASWIGWDENTNLDDVKVKLIKKNNLDPGEFDVWDNNKEQADAVNIPIPNINARNNARMAQAKLMSILGKAGYKDVQVNYLTSISNRTDFEIRQDTRYEIESQIQELDVV